MNESDKKKLFHIYDDGVASLQLMRIQTITLNDYLIRAIAIGITTDESDFLKGVLYSIGLKSLTDGYLVAESEIKKTARKANPQIDDKELAKLIKSIASLEQSDEIEWIKDNCELADKCVFALCLFSEGFNVFMERICKSRENWVELASFSAMNFRQKILKDLDSGKDEDYYECDHAFDGELVLKMNILLGENYNSKALAFIKEFELDQAKASGLLKNPLHNVSPFNIGFCSAIGLRFLYLPLIAAIEAIAKKYANLKARLSDEEFNEIKRLSSSNKVIDNLKLEDFGIENKYIHCVIFINRFSVIFHFLSQVSKDYIDDQVIEPLNAAEFSMMVKNREDNRGQRNDH